MGCYLSEGMSAKKLCHASWYHQKSGGVGLEDLARDPANSSDMDHSGHYNRWVRHILAREHGDASMSLVSAPMHDKKNSCRTEVSIPVAMPSDLLSQHLLGHVGLVDESDIRKPLPLAEPHVPWTPGQNMHSVVVNAVANGAHLSRIRRVGFFLDDAGFTKKRELLCYVS